MCRVGSRGFSSTRGLFLLTLWRSVHQEVKIFVYGERMGGLRLQVRLCSLLMRLWGGEGVVSVLHAHGPHSTFMALVCACICTCPWSSQYLHGFRVCMYLYMRVHAPTCVAGAEFHDGTVWLCSSPKCGLCSCPWCDCPWCDLLGVMWLSIL